ncbi:MAG: tRNA (guanosine(18)-2'-O)-methyltransferase TrmH [Gemmatimonadetes bacterium]|nr:tRNA (guanosine(18)-2'-O)-methyltransferase TrmH [Gemmatimonadota bacterium]
MTPERFARIEAVLSRRQPDLTVLMDRVHKPHNLSAVARSCDAVGVLEVHAVPAGAETELHRDTSAGSSKWVPVRSHPSTEAALALLRDEGFRTVAAHPDPAAVDFRALDYTAPTAFVVGTELEGLSAAALAQVDRTVVVPMRGMVQSLNVSVATALLLYEAERQRDQAGFYDRSRLEPERYRALRFEWAYPDLARRCRAAGVAYPDLTEVGEIVDLPPLPGLIASE